MIPTYQITSVAFPFFFRYNSTCIDVVTQKRVVTKERHCITRPSFCLTSYAVIFGFMWGGLLSELRCLRSHRIICTGNTLHFLNFHQPAKNREKGNDDNRSVFLVVRLVRNNFNTRRTHSSQPPFPLPTAIIIIIVKWETLYFYYLVWCPTATPKHRSIHTEVGDPKNI